MRSWMLVCVFLRCPTNSHIKAANVMRLVTRRYTVLLSLARLTDILLEENTKTHDRWNKGTQFLHGTLRARTIFTQGQQPINPDDVALDYFKIICSLLSPTQVLKTRLFTLAESKTLQTSYKLLSLQCCFDTETMSASDYHLHHYPLPVLSLAEFVGTLPN